jgi:hypothetical protein
MPSRPKQQLVAAAVGGLEDHVGADQRRSGQVRPWIDAVTAGVEVVVAVAAPDLSGGLERRVPAGGHVGGVEGQRASRAIGRN